MHGQDIRPGADARFDLGYEQARQAWLEAARPDLVIHLAALYGRVWGERDLTATAAANAGMTAALARDVADAGARLLYASSSEVYGAAAASPDPLDGTSPLGPLNMYGLTKKWGEEACRLYCPDGLAVARLNMPYGPAAVLPEPGAVPHHSGPGRAARVQRPAHDAVAGASRPGHHRAPRHGTVLHLDRRRHRRAGHRRGVRVRGHPERVPQPTSRC